MDNSSELSVKAPGWTRERTTLAKTLWAAGQSATEIGMRLGVSRCAVLSKMYREKDHGGRAAPSAPPAAKAQHLGGEGLARVRRDVNRSVVRGRRDLDLWRSPPEAELEATDGPPQADAAAFAPLPGTIPRPWISRSREECAWPVEVGEAEMQYACCAPTAAGHIYCAAHRRWALDPAGQPTAGENAREADTLVAWLARRGA